MNRPTIGARGVALLLVLFLFTGLLFTGLFAGLFRRMRKTSRENLPVIER